MSGTATVEHLAREALASVMDPEIAGLSIADLGMIERVDVGDDAIEATLLPTFVGCPAQFAIREDAERALRGVAGRREVRVRLVFDPPWTTDRITPAGREVLRRIGISPPHVRGDTGVPLLQVRLPCPYCGSLETVTEGEFGPTPCRSIRYCAACRNPFEGFKTKER